MARTLIDTAAQLRALKKQGKTLAAEMNLLADRVEMKDDEIALLRQTIGRHESRISELESSLSHALDARHRILRHLQQTKLELKRLKEQQG